GEILWERKHYYPRTINAPFSYLTDIRQTMDGGFIASGGGVPDNIYRSKFWLLKLDSMGCLSATDCGITSVEVKEIPINDLSINVYPNPTTGVLHIQIQNPQVKIESITMYDIAGKQLLHQKQPQGNAGSYSLSFGEGWGEATGLYFIQITLSNGTTERLRFIKK